MTDQEKHQQNLALYLANGGKARIAKQYQELTLQNRSKIAYLVKDFKKESINISTDKSSEKPLKETPKQEKKEEETIQSTPHHQLLGLISHYPGELHETYTKAFNCWIKACSLKVQLNQIPEEKVEEAYELQCEIWEQMQEFDQCKKVLDYYKEEKAILPTKSAIDVTKLDSLELDRRLRNLRTYIVKRQDTLQKLFDNIPDKSDVKYNSRRSIYVKKLEELENYKLEAKNIEKELAKRFGSNR